MKILFLLTILSLTAFAAVVPRQEANSHEGGHQSAGVDAIDGDNLGGIDTLTPANYTASTAEAGCDTTDELCAHLKGIDNSLSGSGQSNTASNQGVGGIGVFDLKSGVDLQFRNVNAASSAISVVLDAGNKEIDIDVVDANLTIASTQVSDFDTAVSANSAVAANTAKVSAGGSIDAHSDVDVTTNAPAAGEMFIFDGSNWVPSDDEIYNDTIQTIGNGANTYRTLTVVNDEIMTAEITCNAVEADGSLGGYLKFSGTYLKDGVANAVELGVTSIVAHENCGGGNSACAVLTTLSTPASVLLQVDGATGQTIDWTCRTTVTRG